MVLQQLKITFTLAMAIPFQNSVSLSVANAITMVRKRNSLVSCFKDKN